MAELDPQDMAGAIAGFAKQVHEALVMPLPSLAHIKRHRIARVLFVGMGGSGAGGAYAAAYMDVHGGPVARVVHDYILPAWADESTLLVATSYSGNTEETLCAVAEAQRRGLPWIGVGSGGRLEAAARVQEAPFVKVPGGLQPRAAFGYLFVPVLRAVAALGLVDRNAVETSLALAVPMCEQLASECALSVPAERNAAKQLARELHGRSVLLMAEGSYEPVAERIRCQLNENSKVRAFVRVLPEANHNDSVAWMSDPGMTAWMAVWVGRFDRHASLQVRADFTEAMLREQAVPSAALPHHSDDDLANWVVMTHYGDWVSLYLAMLNTEDPSDVSVIPELKRRCASTGVVDDACRQLGID